MTPMAPDAGKVARTVALPRGAVAKVLELNMELRAQGA